jgi:hypothetical protein
MYATMSTLVWVIMMASSALSFYAPRQGVTQEEKSFSDVENAQPHVMVLAAVFLRRAGKVIACLNAIWLILACIFQFSGVFETCYCNASVIGRGVGSFSLIILDEEAGAAIFRTWCAGLALAVTGAFLFMMFVQIFFKATASRRVA